MSIYYINQVFKRRNGPKAPTSLMATSMKDMLKNRTSMIVNIAKRKAANNERTDADENNEKVVEPKKDTKEYGDEEEDEEGGHMEKEGVKDGEEEEEEEDEEIEDINGGAYKARAGLHHPASSPTNAAVFDA